MLHSSGEQKTLGDIEVEDRIAQIHGREHSLEKSTQEALRKGIREQLYEEQITSTWKILVQMGAVIAAIFLVYIIFWWLSGGYPLEGFLR